MGKAVNKQELADIFGYSLPTIGVWIKDGCPIVGAGGRGKDYSFDTAEVHRWLVARDKPDGRLKGPRATLDDDGEEITIDQARLRKEFAAAKIAELELAEALEKVAPQEMILRVLSHEIANARARLLSIPSRLRPLISLVVGKRDDTNKLVQAVEDSIHDALKEIKAGQ